MFEFDGGKNTPGRYEKNKWFIFITPSSGCTAPYLCLCGWKGFYFEGKTREEKPEMSRRKKLCGSRNVVVEHVSAGGAVASTVRACFHSRHVNRADSKFWLHRGSSAYKKLQWPDAKEPPYLKRQVETFQTPSNRMAPESEWWCSLKHHVNCAIFQQLFPTNSELKNKKETGNSEILLPSVNICNLPQNLKKH